MSTASARASSACAIRATAKIEYEHAAFTADGDPNLRLILYAPVAKS